MIILWLFRQALCCCTVSNNDGPQQQQTNNMQNNHHVLKIMFKSLQKALSCIPLGANKFNSFDHADNFSKKFPISKVCPISNQAQNEIRFCLDIRYLFLWIYKINKQEKHRINPFKESVHSNSLIHSFFMQIMFWDVLICVV